MFYSLGEIAMAPASKAGCRRTGEPVRRDSVMKGRDRLQWRPISRRDARQIVDGARRYDRAGRQPGERNGPLGHVALEVLDYLANLIDFRTGQLDPALTTLMAKLHRSRDAIVRALAALRTHGFLDWLRRYEPTGNEGRGPKLKQASNAYRLFLPPAAARLLDRMTKPAPPPDDFTHRQEQEAAEIEAHKATLPLAERGLFNWTGDDDLGAQLARLGRLIERDQCESARQSESGARFKSMKG